jgi:thiosulfate/3-mercaptopyruvate sulfurtransferase
MSMLTFVSADWVEQRLDSPDFQVLDPRSSIRYMAGHPRNAINVSVAKARDSNGRIFSAEDLARWLGACGVDDRRTPVLYDNSDGRNAALLAWMLMYLGRTDVHLMNSFWERWVADGREAFYRPVKAAPQTFTARVRPELRRTMSEVQQDTQDGTPGGPDARTARKLVDLRSVDEFTGKLESDPRPGHIPGAVNIVWQELAGKDGNLLVPAERIDELFAAQGVGPQDRVVAYCKTGLRAALGFLALAQMGREVALYDGSYSEWAQSDLPVERALTE